MDASRRFLLIFRWSLTMTLLTALFWSGWYLVFGEVPDTSISSIQLDEKTTLVFPFTVSRWRDILLAPVWTSLLVFILSKAGESNNKDDFVAGLVISLVVSLGVSLGTSLGTGLGVGLVISLGAGLGAGLVADLAIILGVSLVAGLAALIKGVAWLVSKNTLSTFYNWLMVRDVA